MTVLVTKPTVNIREKLSELDKPSGIAGREILKADTPQEVFNYIGAGRRNLIINGAMQVWQRGTSGFTVSGGYTADRWWMSSATSIERSTDAPEGFSYSLKVNTATDNTAIGQPIELVTGSSSPMIAGETVTLSFYAKTATGTDSIGATINFRDAKFSATNQAAFGDMGSKIITTAWQRFTGTFTVPNINATNVLAGLEIYGIDGDIYITGVQLEVGSVATPFEHRSYGEELALCQRYYQSWTQFDTFVTARYNAGAGNPFGSLPYRTTMRVNPSISIGGTWRTTSGFTAVGGANSYQGHIRVYGSVTANANSVWYVESYPDGFIAADAEL